VERPVAIVEQATLPGQRLIAGCLGDICLQALAAQVAAPALLIVGEVARRAAHSADVAQALLERGAVSA
jgi:uroporphyrin-III C-methyltransferase/precorrin-2 dehydrogenase/sirohydrochlorin ferrochelatase